MNKLNYKHSAIHLEKYIVLVLHFSMFIFMTISVIGSTSPIQKTYLEKMVHTDQNSQLSLGEANLKIPAGALHKDQILSMELIASDKVPALNQSVRNIIPSGNAYRFGPSGSTFIKPLMLTLPFDTLAVNRQRDISVFSYQPEVERWTKVIPDTILWEQGVVCVKINHFTDFITGIIKVPESPETKGYQPTEIKDIKAANAAAEIDFIELPEASNMGGANLNFPIMLPEGRNGLHPSLSLNYNNQAGSSWVGLGWSLNIPAIHVDTKWGVPRYSTSRETETYSYGGEQLWPVAHRSEFILRQGIKKRFYPRVEKDFKEIIRHGDAPGNYWWEVTEKSGRKHYFGGTPETGVEAKAVLQDQAGNIGKWFLLKTIDANGNYIEYSYRESNYGDFTESDQKYIDEINYTGHELSEPSYSILFDTDSELSSSGTFRKDIKLDCRMGFPNYDSELLQSIEVKFKNNIVRSYRLKYYEGAFYKTLLESIQVLDAKGNMFYEYELDYYDEVRNQDGTYFPLLPAQDVELEDDNLKGGLIAPQDGYEDKLSPIGSSYTSNFSYGGAFTIGAPGSPVAKNNTVGGNYTRTQGKGFGLTSLVDVDGDKRPDKVMSIDGNLYFRKNISGTALQGDLRFSQERYPVIGVDHFSQYDSKGHSKGLEANVRPFSISKGSNKSVTTTHTYYSDFNSDGLIDIARRGRVLFGFINSEGLLEYTALSDSSASPINAGAEIDGELLSDDDGDQPTLEEEFPLHDLVISWTAPEDGEICINAPLTFLPDNSQAFQEYTGTPDGIKGRIQLSRPNGSDEIELDTTDVFGGGSSLETRFFDLDNPIDIERGDRLFFRMQSVYDGNFDRAHWNPEIYYVDNTCSEPSSSVLDANNRNIKTYIAKEDYHLFAPQSLVMPINGKIALYNDFYKPLTSDSITVEIVKIDTLMDEEVLYQSILPWNETYTALPGLPDSTVFDVKKREELIFRLHSPTNVDWSAVKWFPHIAFVEAADGTEIYDEAGNPAVQAYPAVEADIYGETHRMSQPFVLNDTSDISIRWPLLQEDELMCCYQDDDIGEVDITISLKGKNKLYGRSTGVFIPATFIWQEGTMILPSNLITVEDIPEGEELFIEVHMSNSYVANYLSDNFYVELRINGEVEYMLPGLYSKQSVEDLGFGPQYRGWGRFVYNGNAEREHLPIEQEDLRFDPDDYDTGGIEDIENPDELDSQFDPTKQIMVFLASDPLNGRWIGADDLTYLSFDTLSSSRLGEDNLEALNLGASAGGLSAPVKKTLTRGESESISASAGIGLSGGINSSSGRSVNVIEVMDMNGDGYPDLVKNGVIQYTMPTGGLDEGTRNHTDIQDIGVHQSRSNSIGATAGGSLSSAMFGNDKGGGGPFTINIGKQASQNAKAAERQSSTGASLNGGVNKSQDETDQTWIDVNGDGLQDLVRKDGRVYLNIGYDFLPSRNWSFEGGIRGGETEGENFSLGATIANRSISFGITLNSSTNKAFRAFQDVTGDGLVDRIRYNEDRTSIEVSQNLGDSFSSDWVPWVRNKALDQGNSIGESANTAFTVCINFLFFRVCVNPQASIGRGLSRHQTQFKDINGDGFPDFLESYDGDGDLRVQLSRTGKTNMLKTIKRPLYGVITLDYERLENSYDLPSSPWVLSSASLYDGLPEDGADTMRYHYHYEDGYRDRHERQFYGFAKVVTEELDTENDNEVYRSRETVYANDTYYRRGLKLSETTYDADGRVFERMTYEYQLKDVFNGSPVADDLDLHDGLAFPAKIAETTYFHEGRDPAPLQRRITYDYDEFGNVTTYRDNGDGTPNDWVQANIDYHFLSDPYIFSPSNIEVIISSGMIRKREADIDPVTGDITQIRQFLSEDQAAVYDMEYDTYGNLLKIIRPANHNGERMYFEYEYDDEVQTYITKVTDAYGYESSTTYDYRFGKRLGTVDMNGQEVRYTLDAKGRMASVTGPYELAAGVPYTIAMNYHPDAAVPYARTRHFEPDHPDRPIETYTFMDGLQRPVQVKKTGSLYSGEGQADIVEMIVSGRVVFDAFGRTVENYHPTTEPLGNEASFSTDFDLIPPTRKSYDVLDRETEIVLPDGATTEKTYDIGPDNNGAICLFTSTVDPLGNRKDAYMDVRERQCANVDFGPDGEIWTTFRYNPINELLTVTDVAGNVSSYEYDRLGRKISFTHPDAGRTVFIHDLAGNLLRKQTAELRASLGGDAFIEYGYEYQRPISIAYPRHYQNNVRYHYGEPGAPYNRAGRIWLQEDGSGGIEFFYGSLGEQVKTIRTIVVNQTTALTYISESEYDTWNRIKRMKYPDGEEIAYHYNRAGKLRSLEGVHEGNEYTYVKQLGYDKFEQRVFLAYGNGTSTTYTYEPDRRRLSTVKAFSEQEGSFLDMAYSYDVIDNITSVTNSVELIGAGQLGGSYTQSYSYDELYRLTQANGEWSRGGLSSNYSLEMAYDNLHNIATKKQKHVQNGFEQSGSTYENHYDYSATRPHVPDRIGSVSYLYDANGNLKEMTDGSPLVDRQMIWDEENRLQGVIDRGSLSRYTYDAKGERVIKSHGNMQALFFNGVEAGFIDHSANYTIYVSPYLVARRKGFSKHYFIETQRIASRLGEGRFLNNALSSAQGITAGQLDYQERVRLISQAAGEFYEQIDGAPGHPVDPDQPNVPLPVIFLPDSSYDNSTTVWQSLLPEGPPGSSDPPGHPVWQDSRPPRDLIGAGYGWEDTALDETDFLYFFHSDHLGSTGYITDINGRVSQHAVYMPFGETLVEEFDFSSAEAAQPYLFNGKELDRETGLYYYGARYYDPGSSIWLSLDPMMEKYPGWSPYNYTLQNPVKLVDPDGNYPRAAISSINKQFSKDRAKKTSDFWTGPRMEMLQNAADFSVGFADAITGGMTSLFNKEVMGTDQQVNHGSGFNQAGKATGTAWNIALGAHSKGAKITVDAVTAVGAIAKSGFSLSEGDTYGAVSSLAIGGASIIAGLGAGKDGLNLGDWGAGIIGAAVREGTNKFFESFGPEKAKPPMKFIPDDQNR